MTPGLSAFLVLISTASVLSAYENDYRLPDTTKPIQYTISLTLDPNDQQEVGGFFGDTHIKISADKVTDTIVLHANKIQINKISVKSGGNEIFDRYSQLPDDTDFLRISLKTNLTVGTQYDIYITHWSNYGVLDGAYRSYYYDSKNIIRWMISTQFAPVSARKVFPCYDEPALKAKFTIEIHAPDDFSVMSNMNAKTTALSHIDGYNVTTFHETPIMSTYLIAFVVSQFEQLSLGNFAINARAEAMDDVEFALEVGNASLRTLESYLGVNYSMPKMDYVAVPDFLFNAMENWGLTTYKEEVLLYNKSQTPSSVEKKIITVISHENAHNWFGNEVTHMWWGYVWLKEGFATYFENYITDEITKGEMRQMEQFVVHTLQDTMLFDSLVNTNPMSSSVATPSDFMANYNYVAYPKAGSVIRMIGNALGESTFKAGLTDYLINNAKKSATPKMLFESLDRAINGSSIIPNNITIDTIFSSWSDQASYPLVYVEHNKTTKELIIYHERYYQNATMTQSKEQWWIPTSIQSEKVDPRQFWIEPNKIYKQPFDDNENWYLLNNGLSGYFRVAYEMENLIKLNQTLNSGNYEIFLPLTRAQLLDDTFELAKTNRLPYKVPLDMAMYLENETDYIPWVSAQRALNYIGQFPKMKDSYHFMSFKQKLVKKLYERVGFDYKEDDSLLMRLTRNLAIDIACGAGIQSCRDNIVGLSLDFFNNNKTKTVHPDLRNQVYNYGYSNGHISYDDLWKMFVNTKYQSERSIILDALSRRNNYSLQKVFIEKSLESMLIIRNHERPSIVISVIKSGEQGVRVALEFLLAHYFQIQKMSQSPNAMARIIDTLGSKIYNTKNLNDFKYLELMYRTILSASEKRAFERAFEGISLNQRWIEEEIPEIEKWLEENYNSAGIKKISFLLIIISSFIVFFIR